MDTKKLIDDLRICADDDTICPACERYDKMGVMGGTAECVSKLLLEAAAQLEEQQKQIAELEKERHWIPVTERVPDIPDGWAEHPDPVLYMMKSTGMIYAGYYGENGTYRDKYFRQYADGHEGVDADDALCWMWQHDLPEPPKEE